MNGDRREPARGRHTPGDGRESRPETIPPDYDRDPDRFRLARSVLRRHGASGDVHERVARRLEAEGLTPVLDVGCGEGELARFLPSDAWVGLDSSPTMLARAPEPHVLGDATALPFPDASFGSVAALYVLYHLPEPARAIAEAHRVLRAGGLLVAAAPSRHDSPELSSALAQVPLTFDAESGPEHLSRRFTEVEVERWDAPLLTLPSQAAVQEYLVGKGVGQARARAAAAATDVPLVVTKRGALLFACKR